MYSLLLVVIYLAYISLGLPDSLLGSGWPAMYKELGVDISYAGIITVVISVSTLLSTLIADKLVNRFHARIITSVSVLITAVALLGFSLSNSFFMLCVIAIPYGLGAGAVDAVLNNYVAIHFRSKHMNFLHCFWGLGASISPYIMSRTLLKGYTWNKGYFVVFIVQAVIAGILFITLPVWKKVHQVNEDNLNKEISHIKSNDKEMICKKSMKDMIRQKGAIFAVGIFFFYCAFEATISLWSSSYFVEVSKMNKEMAVKYSAIFFVGITLGRIITGFLTEKFQVRKLLRFGMGIIFISLFSLTGFRENYILQIISLFLIGFGCAPIYPCMVHETPGNFGTTNPQAMISLQITSAYLGSTLIPPLFGLIAGVVSMKLYPYFSLVFLILLVIFSESLIKTIKKKD